MKYVVQLEGKYSKLLWLASCRRGQPIIYGLLGWLIKSLVLYDVNFDKNLLPSLSSPHAKMGTVQKENSSVQFRDFGSRMTRNRLGGRRSQSPNK
jgi:hypothetical protein